MLTLPYGPLRPRNSLRFSQRRSAHEYSVVRKKKKKTKLVLHSTSQELSNAGSRTARFGFLNAGAVAISIIIIALFTVSVFALIALWAVHRIMLS
jgi:hypothetical protein